MSRPQRLLSDEVLATWRKAPGRAPEAVTSALGELATETGKRLNQLLLELVTAVTQAGSQPAFADSVARLFAAKQPAADAEAEENLAELPALQSGLCDVLWLLWVKTEGAAAPEECAERLKIFGRRLLDAGVLSQAQCVARLPRGLLDLMQVYANPRLRIPVLKAVTRYKSQALYAQTKFNLLREESEGYAKLVTALETEFSRSAELADSGLREALVPGFVSKLRSLIGYFDLDPNRVLDLVLSVYERHLRYRYVSERAELLVGAVRQLFNPDSVVHLLGFKFQGLKDQPESRYLSRLTAVLLRAGLINLELLYPYLSPSDDQLVEDARLLLLSQLKQAKAITTVSLNAPSGSGVSASPSEAGVDDSEQAAAEQPAAKVGHDQKISLLQQCLHVRALDAARTLLGHLQSTRPAADKAVCDSLLALVHGLMEPFYAPLAKQWRAFCVVPPPVPVTSSNPATSSSSASAATASEAMDVDNEEQEQAAAVSDCKPSDFAPSLLPWLRWLQVYLYRDPVLFAKVCRVLAEAIRVRCEASGTATVKPLPEEEQLLLHSLIPAFSMLSSNVGAAAELWPVLSQFDYPDRYRVYGYWKSEVYDEHPELAIRRATIIRRTNYFKRRVTKHNATELSRHLMKFALNNPLVVFPEILGQLQMFGNMVAPLVDCFRRCTPLAFDVVPYLMLETLGARSDAEKLKEDGINEAAWFQNLATFAGMFFKKYAREVQLDSLMVFIGNQLRDERFADLLLLRELISHMAGIECTDEPMVSQEQLEGRAGGNTLRALTISRQLKSHHRSASALYSSLVQNDLVLSLYVLLQQHKQHVIYRSETGNLAVLGSWLDKLQTTIVQLMDFVSGATPDNQEYLKLLASVPDLAGNFHLGHGAALWALSRSLQLTQAAGLLNSASPGATSADDSASSTSDDSAPAGAMAVDSEAMDGKEEPEAGNPAPFKIEASKYGPPAPILETAQRLLPEEVWQYITPNLFMTFWGLGLYDLHLPQEAYEAHIKATETQLVELEQDRVNGGSAESRKAQDRLRDTLAKLRAELKEQSKSTQECLLRMKLDRRNWFAVPAGSGSEESLLCTEAFMTTCILPRMLMSSADAVFCGKFLRLLHQVGAEHLPYVFSVHTVVRILGAMLSSCTPFEATRIGRFLQVLFAQVQLYRTDRVLYNRECTDNLAFWRAGPGEPPADHNQFTMTVYRWHKLLLRMFLNKLSDSSNALNALLLLNQIQKYFPVIEQHCDLLGRRVEQLMEQDEGQFKVLGSSYNRSLQADRVSWLTLEQFSPFVAAQRTPAKGSVSKVSADSNGSSSRSSSRASSRRTNHSESSAATVAAAESERRYKPLRAGRERDRSTSPPPPLRVRGGGDGRKQQQQAPPSRGGSPGRMQDDQEPEVEADVNLAGSGESRSGRRKRKRLEGTAALAEAAVAAAADSSRGSDRNQLPRHSESGSSKRQKSAEPEPEPERRTGGAGSGGGGGVPPNRPRGRGGARNEDSGRAPPLRGDSPPRRGGGGGGDDQESDRGRGRRHGGGGRGRGRR